MQNSYESFTATDFVSDENFLRHYLNPTTDSRRFWAGWLAQHPDCQSEWNQARQLIEAVVTGLSDYARTYLSAEAETQLLTRILTINAQVQPVATVRPLWQNARLRLAVAACFLLVIGCWAIFRTLNKPSVYEQNVADQVQPLIETRNLSVAVRLVRLPDGSTVTLAPQSQLAYPTHYGQQTRTVYLHGQATFDVAKNHQKPFLVYAGEVVTKVLGTRFVVRSFERDPGVTVIVQQGEVSVYRNPLQATPASDRIVQGVLLRPNQQVVFSRETETFAKSLIPAPQRIDSAQRTLPGFVFSETPIALVFDSIEQAYGIQIVYNSEVLRNCQLTASLTDEPLFQKLDVIVQSIDATYQLVDGQIVINAKGCPAN